MQKERDVCGCSGMGKPVGTSYPTLSSYGGLVVDPKPIDSYSLRLLIDMLERAEERKKQEEEKAKSSG